MLENLKRFRRYFEGYEGLSEEFVEFLHNFPMASECNIGRLAKLGSTEWTPTESVLVDSPGPIPMEADVLGILEDVYRYHEKVTFDGANVMLVAYEGSKMHISGSMWVGGYLAVLAWWDLHPLVLEPSLLTGQERLDEIKAEIPYTFAGLDMREAVELTENLGWDQATTNYVFGAIGAAVGRSTKAPAVLALCENRLRGIDGNSVLIEDGSSTTVFIFADKRFMQIVAALDERRKNLAIRWL